MYFVPCTIDGWNSLSPMVASDGRNMPPYSPETRRKYSKEFFFKVST